MPATEKTWRDQLKMHTVFGVTSLVMLLATIWMLWKDHNREWRRWQAADRDRAVWTIRAQLAQTQAESQDRHNQLSSQLAEVRRHQLEDALIGEFRAAVEAEDQRLREAGLSEDPANFESLDSARAVNQATSNGTDEAADARAEVLDAMAAHNSEARRRELALTQQRKFMAADLTSVVSLRGIAVGEGRPTEEYEIQIARLNDQIAEQDVKVVAAKSYRQKLESIVASAQAEETDLQRQVAAIEADINRLQAELDKNPVSVLDNPLEPITRLPILDAFYTGPMKLDQIWLPYMTINYNFSSVARYDRCINCHRAIDKTAPGSAVDPAYPAVPRDERTHVAELAAPAPAPEAEDGLSRSEIIERRYGIRLAERGQVNADDVTIQVVRSQSPAAKAGLEMGDVITAINGGAVRSHADVYHYLIDYVEVAKPQAIQYRRGLDQPFTSHPRLDLFVGSTSPHKRGEMGCTICHDGQGSATDFKWASHTPNDPKQAREWALTHGWFDNHHWIFPMTPHRFIESNCLKCHHEVTDLEPSARFPEPPAPKLVEGYHLIREFGCYGCHEINGFDGPNKRIGPDLRVQPNYHEVAAQLLQDPGLNEEERNWANLLIDKSGGKEVRDELFRALKADAALAAAASRPAPPPNGTAPDAAAPTPPRMMKESHQLADALRDVEVPGSLRKAGPSLRHLASKVDYNWLYSWIRKPSDFRPTTRMPQFFLHHDHLEDQVPEFVLHDVDGNEQKVTDEQYTRRFENIEIRALAEFLLNKSQPFQFIDPPAGVTEAPSVERGKQLFETRGCLACHSHSAFPAMEDVRQNKVTQGPDLSRLAAKLDTERGRSWLYSWLKQPNEYHPQTLMPNLYLDPIAETNPTGVPTGRVTDPAADILAFLLSVPAEWQPEAAAPSQALLPQEARDLEDLTAVWLAPSFQSKRLAARYAREGIPQEIAGSVKVDELVLVGMTPENRTQKQLEYVARRSISRYGCFGCHDIPGFETAKPIGTPLANWGRKDTSQLAFENVATFLERHGVDGNQQPPAEGHGDSHGHGLNPLNLDPDTGYFIQSLLGHQRMGFLWQKLRMPRSFDYETTVNKRYDERLRMPKFPLSAEQREAVMTFVLGLTSEAPDQRYIYKPDPRRAAIVKGRQVIDKYNCAGCHVLEMDRWQVSFDPGQLGKPPTPTDFPFVVSEPTPEEARASTQPDRRGRMHAELYGMLTRNEQTGEPQRFDADGVPLAPDDTESRPHYKFSLYKHAVVEGAMQLVGDPEVLIPAAPSGAAPADGEAHAGWGGDLAKYLYPRVIAQEKAVNPAAIPTEAWGWLPPPLYHEGDKVQTDWLHDFLMDPIALRPAVVMRMPNFHMTSEEASALVNYFAAQSGAEFPYEYNVRRRSGHLAREEAVHPGLLDDAMKIVTGGNFCVKCHSVGDFQVQGAVKTLGPRLDHVYQRLRPEYLRRWIAAPRRILPYTGMPINITHGDGVSQDLFRGSSTQQLDGVVELLMNYDEYARRRTSVRSLVRDVSPGAAPAGGAPPARRGGGAGGN
jgi:cytochrome c2